MIQYTKEHNVTRTKYNVTKEVESWSSKEESTMLQGKHKVDPVKNKVQSYKESTKLIQ